MPKPYEPPSVPPMTAADVTALWRSLERWRAQPSERRAAILEQLGLTPADGRRAADLIDRFGDIRVLEPGQFIGDADGCSLGWQPSVLAPVFHGFSDFGTEQGLPARLRVYYPSVEGTPRDAPMVKGCGRYPLVAFLHGQCAEADHFQKWDLAPIQLARSGYVVAVPELQNIGPFSDEDTDVARAEQVLLWMRTQWVHAAALMPRPMTAIVGHSWGALTGGSLAVRLQSQGAVSAYASLSGGWLEWPSIPPRPLPRLNIATLFVYGTGPTDEFASLEGANAALFNEPRGAAHKVMIRDGEHWDYFREGGTECATARGPCAIMRNVAADFLATFLSHYMPPEKWTLLGSTIPHTLLPPPLTLTPRQEFFAGGHLQGFRALPGTTCSITHTWRLPPALGGSETFGPA